MNSLGTKACSVAVKMDFMFSRWQQHELEHRIGSLLKLDINHNYNNKKAKIIVETPRQMLINI